MEGTDFWMTSKRAGLRPEAAHKLNTKHKSLRLTDSCKEKGTKMGNRKLGKRKFMEKNNRVLLNWFTVDKYGNSASM